MTTASTKRWGRWETGKFRLHLAAGNMIEFVGRCRIQHETESAGVFAVDYEVVCDSLLMPPRFSAIESIEQVSTALT